MEREAFLTNLRDRLAAAPPFAGAHPPGPPPGAVPPVAFAADPRPLEERFAAALIAQRGRVVTREDLPSVLAELDVHTAVTTTDALDLPPDVEVLPLDRAREADAGVTLAAAAAAATGTVFAAAAPDEPRGASLLPRVHVAVVRRDTLVEAPGDVLRALPQRFPHGLPSALSAITGPSRSADIGGEVVYGVHGPLAVLAVLL